MPDQDRPKLRGDEVKRNLAGRGGITLAALALTLTACGGDANSETDGGSGVVTVDGSSTVFPLSNAAAEALFEERDDIEVTVGEAGTGGGFEAFCAGKTDISDASRPIDDEEIAACEAEGIEYTELQVATDALTVVVPSDFEVDCVTTDQLAKLWAPSAEGKITNWKQIDPAFPDQDITLLGPGADSGTFDYFTEQIVGEEGQSRSDYEASEDDNVIAQGVGGTEGAMGYFGYTYFEQNVDTLKALQINTGEECVAPSAETAQDGSYNPLARPLYIYVSNKAYADNEAVATYVDFYIDNLDRLGGVAKFIPLSDEQTAVTADALAKLKG
jgi:phosphate transport system substrate-binding protein